VFNLGDGQDVVTDNGPYSTASYYKDTLRFGAGIGQDDLWFHRVGDDLVLSAIDAADSVTVKNWYLNNNYKIEATSFADGTSLTVAQVESLVAAMASYSPPTGTESSSNGYSTNYNSELTVTHAF